MFKRLTGATFFKTLPPKLKIALHFLELLLGLYFATAVSVKAIFNDPVLLGYCIQIAIVYLTVYPFVHLAVEMLSGVDTACPPANPTLTKSGNGSK